ncbi:hypothetical protein [Streptomyces sp. NPDC091215]|uniref:hypothetical protein n=1 Tax=Streptomyces sp. NPDC091215 TaxID=3155192 RepID=UPI0034465516
MSVLSMTNSSAVSAWRGSDPHPTIVGVSPVVTRTGIVHPDPELTAQHADLREPACLQPGQQHQYQRQDPLAQHAL